jgi:putative transposase
MAWMLKEAFAQLRRGDFELEALLPAAQVQAACEAAGYQDRGIVYTSLTIMTTFLAQMLRADRSCQQAVAGVAAHRTAQGRSPCSADTGGYCKARQRIPEAVYTTLMRRSAETLEARAPAEALWNGRRVRVVDGSTLHLADTPANRSEYPLQEGLTPGCHYPVVRILVVFSLMVGVVMRASLRAYQGKGTGETSMLRDLSDCFARGDVLLGDRYFAGFWDLAWWVRQGVDVVTRLPASRFADFRRGRRLGKNDHLITWRRTPRPDWLTPEEAAGFPQTLTLREVRVSIEIRGFRTKQVTVITTLLDNVLFSAHEITELYRRRWQAELNLRSLKTHMEMDYLRTKRPETVRKEFAMHMLAYNLVRGVAFEAAQTAGVEPWTISFKGTLQTTHEFLARFHHATSLDQWVDDWLATTAQIRVGHRPDRIEPYAIKRRPKDYPPLQEPRTEYKKRLRPTG